MLSIKEHEFFKYCTQTSTENLLPMLEFISKYGIENTKIAIQNSEALHILTLTQSGYLFKGELPLELTALILSKIFGKDSKKKIHNIGEISSQRQADLDQKLTSEWLLTNPNPELTDEWDLL